jgi:glutathione S-transferase
MLKLFYSPGACSLAIHILLEEINEPYDREIVSSRGARQGEMTATDKWRAVNPKGRVPALLGVPGNAGGLDNLLTEVPAMSLYLARSYPDRGLLPSTVAGEARCIEWMNWLSGNVHAMTYGQIWRANRFVRDEKDEAPVREKGYDNVRQQYDYIEKLLSDGREWAVPGAYSVVDPYLLVFFIWGLRIGLPMRDRHAAWSHLTDHTVARPAVQRALADEKIAIL